MSAKTLRTQDETQVIFGSSLKGYIQTTRANIETIFGAPTWLNGSEDKVTTEWAVEVDGTLATIYDWKRYEQGAPEMNELIYWNIGGFSSEATDKVAEALGVTALSSNYPIWLHI